MNDIGQLTTFRRLMEEEAVILIPKVQRDYAYGRREEKVEEVLNGMLDSMLTAVRNNTSEIFDFVYGGSYVTKNDITSGMVPLDGQQRLTTLFLLHFVASVMQKGVPADAVAWLRKFRYETRQSATCFCSELIDEIRDDIIIRREKEPEKSIRSLIEDNPRYLATYATDPTISSMLNVIDTIEDKLRRASIPDIWDALETRDNILFYSLSLEKFGLNDDLYIKMNSRGKKLTEFEIFKSDFENAIKAISPDLKEEISAKIDNLWMDIVWGYARQSDGGDIIAKADKGYMQLFRNIMRLELFRRGIESKQNRQASISEILTDAGAVERIADYFDTFSSIDTGKGLEASWYGYFYFSDDILGRPDRVRLFWGAKNRKPVIHLAMDRDLSMPELTWLYSLYLIHKSPLDESDRRKCLRIISNLLTANIRAHSQRYDMLKGFLDDAEEIIGNNGPVAGEHTFVTTAYEEELTKQSAFSRSDYDRLQQFENHRYLEGSLMLFIEKYLGPDGDTTRLFDELDHFCRIFDNDSNKNFDKLRINLISKNISYMQYDAGMEKDEAVYRRFFIHNADDFSRFLIKNTDRRNQQAVLDVISGELTTSAALLSPEEKCLQFPSDSWQYYYIKYPSANRTDTYYGIYVWDDYAARPMQMVILNSSYHGKNNIEWLMLNHILVSEIWDDNVKYSLDNHGSDAVMLNETGTTLSITQHGWLVRCSRPDIMRQIAESASLYSVVPQDESSYLIDFRQKGPDSDYILLGKQIIADIEKAFSAPEVSD